MTLIEISELRRSHLRDVMRIDALVYPTPWSRKLWITELRRENRVYLAAHRGEMLVGYVGALVAEEDVHVMTIVAAPDHQQLGVGTRLLIEVITRGVDAGCTALTLEVRAGNEPAKALYRRFGMAPAGIRRGYYEPDKEDALVMWVRDIDSSSYRERMRRIALAAAA
ncbi:MAG: ribosomal protein S18-alanine N-acetyltransferase [Acidimicrobiales bacterium]